MMTRAERTQSIGTLLTSVTVVLAVLLVSIFAFWAKDAADRHRQAAHIRSVVTLKRAMLAPRDALRTELGLGSAVSVLLFLSVVLIAVGFIKAFRVDLSRVRGD